MSRWQTRALCRYSRASASWRKELVGFGFKFLGCLRISYNVTTISENMKTNLNIDYLCDDNTTLCLREFIVYRRKSGKEISSCGINWSKPEFQTFQNKNSGCADHAFSKLHHYHTLGDPLEEVDQVNYVSERHESKKQVRGVLWFHCWRVDTCRVPSCVAGQTHTKKTGQGKGKGQKQQMFAYYHLQGSILRSKATSVLALHFSSLSRVFWYLAA